MRNQVKIPTCVGGKKNNESENETGEATYGGRLAPPSQVPLLSFSLSFSFLFVFASPMHVVLFVFVSPTRWLEFVIGFCVFMEISSTGAERLSRRAARGAFGTCSGHVLDVFRACSGHVRM